MTKKKEFLIGPPVVSIYEMLRLARERKCVYWVSQRKVRPAAFFQNWGARHLWESITRKLFRLVEARKAQKGDQSGRSQ